MARNKFSITNESNVKIEVVDAPGYSLIEISSPKGDVFVLLKEPQRSQFINRIKALPSIKQGEQNDEI
jgi:hypothetical protein